MVLGSNEEMGRLGRRLRAEDLAASELVGENGILREKARGLGLEYGRKGGNGEVREVGFFDGRGFLIKSTRPSGEMGWRMWLALVWRYGASVWRAKNLPMGTVKSFEKLLKGKGAFESVSEMVEHAGIGEAVGMSASERLRVNGIGDKYVEEVIVPQLHRQTEQDFEELSDLAISMALAREDEISENQGGSFEMILEKFLAQSQANVQLSTKVTGLKKEMIGERKEGWILELKGPQNAHPTYESFDKVVLAGPWNTNSLREVKNDEEVGLYYRPLWVTFVVTSKELNADYFGSSDKLPSQILPIPSSNLPSELRGIFEISHVADIFGPEVSAESVRKLYRILSRHSILEETVSAFFEGGVLLSFEEKIVNAHPETWPRDGSFGSFKLQDGLWHTGVVDGIWSSVDLSWTAGENVGKLVANELRRGRS
jgi:prenylcysteine oxidase/farnesylcysteine lyase